jgi:hypothetical protein
MVRVSTERTRNYGETGHVSRVWKELAGRSEAMFRKRQDAGSGKMLERDAFVEASNWIVLQVTGCSKTGIVRRGHTLE